jgi:hypothetical protein
VRNCFDKMRGCSYYDQARGLHGYADSGPVTLKFPPDSMYHCKVWIGEPAYGWSKSPDKVRDAHAVRYGRCSVE